MKMATGVHTRVSDYFDGKQDLQTGLARGESGEVLLQGEAEGARGTTTLYKETMNGREVMGYLSGSTGTFTILE